MDAEINALGREMRRRVAILRAGAYELKHRQDVPARVSISEYIDVAKAFFEGDEPKVVNGVLDKLAHEFERV